MSYGSEVVDLVKGVLREDRERIADLACGLACLIEAAERYAGCVGHGQGCPGDPCDCGHEQLRALLVELNP